MVTPKLNLVCPAGHSSAYAVAPGTRQDLVCPRCSLRFQALCESPATLVKYRKVVESTGRAIFWSATFDVNGKIKPTTLNFTAEEDVFLEEGEHISLIWVRLQDRRLVLTNMVRHELPGEPAEDINLAARTVERPQWSYARDGIEDESSKVERILANDRVRPVAENTVWVLENILWGIVRAWPIFLMLVVIALFVALLGQIVGP